MTTNNRRSLLAVMIGSLLAANANAELIISQYVEGGGFNKAIEIANTGDTPLALDDYQLARSANGDGIWGSTLSLDGKTLAAKQVMVFANTSASDAIKAVSDEVENNVTSFNGDDPIAILKSDGSVHDVLGVMGDVDFGKDVTLVRTSAASEASATFNASDWVTLDKDVIDGLGDYDLQAAPEAFTCTDSGAAPTLTTISQIQGSGDSSPFIDGYPYITDEDFFVNGVVTAVTSGLTKGFYLQDVTPDNDVATSDGLFVHTGGLVADLVPGDVVCVKGKVQEYYSHTQLASDMNSYLKQSSGTAPAATPLELLEGENLRQALERHEGMLVQLTDQSALHITRNFSYDYDARRNNMLLSYQAPLYKPTQLHPAESSEAVALAEHNANHRVFVESDQKAPNGQIPYYPDFATDPDQNGSSENHLRLGSRVEGMQAVVTYSYNEYRLIVTNELDKSNFVAIGEGFNVERKAAPSVVDADLHVASFNVLNYFNSVADSGDPNALGQNRGAESFAEFEIQRAKIVAAMKAMNADIIGLMEIENNGFSEGSALNNLVTALNAEFDNTDDHYAYVEIEATDKHQDAYLGSDAIMVAMIYKPSMVEVNQSAQVIPMPEQHIEAGLISREKDNTTNPSYDKYQRHSLLQTFDVKGSDESITIVVNHFKSKGSECIEEWIAGVEDSEPSDLQGNCNNFRVSAAKVLGDAIDQVSGDILVMGDMNAYGMEDPILVLTDYDPAQHKREIKTASYTTLGLNDDGTNKVYQQQGTIINQGYGLVNLNTRLHGAETFSYNYGGELGNLDHALANQSLAQKVVSIEDWHINSLESNLFEYSSKYTGDMAKYQDAYSASDHDPILIAIDYSQEEEKEDGAGSTGLASLLALFGFGVYRRQRRHAKR
jgi:predicted extracellular nuclease